MEAKEMIRKYGIKVSPNDDSKLAIYIKPSSSDLEWIKAHKSEIMDALLEEQRKEEADRETRKRNLESIDGLSEYKDAVAKWNKWHDDLEKSFEGENAVGGMGVGPKPRNPKDMIEDHPQLKAYIKVREMAKKSDAELRSIGKQAMNMFELHADEWQDVMKWVDEQEQKYIDGHKWD